MLLPIRSLVVFSPQREHGQTGPKWHGHSFFHPGHSLFEDPALNVTPPIVVRESFGNALVVPEACGTFHADGNSAMGA